MKHPATDPRNHVRNRNRRRPTRRRWTLSRLSERTLDLIDAEAHKWRISRSLAIERIVAKANAETGREVAR